MKECGGRDRACVDYESALKSSPFRGPWPFSERDARLFYGRAAEVKDLLDVIRTQRLTVLTSESGAGKSSLIQAGLIPAMRLSRERSAVCFGPVLCVSHWDATRGECPGKYLASAISKEIDRLRAECHEDLQPPILGIDDLRDDLDVLRSVELQPTPAAELAAGRAEEGTWFVAFVRDLCDAARGEVVLVIDQAEELLGSATGAPTSFGAVALQMLATAFVDERRLRLVLSIRDDYVNRLRPLDQLVRHVMRRNYHIERMSAEAYRTAVTRTTSLVNEDEINRVLNWVANSAVPGDRDPVDTLVANTILLDLDIRRQELGRNKIDKPLLDDYEVALRLTPGLSTSISSAPVADGAMYRHIERALCPHPDAGIDSLQQPNALVRRAAARMGNVMASPQGFKRYVTDIRLVLESIREDFRSPQLRSVSLAKFRAELPQLRRGAHARDAPPPHSDGALTGLERAGILARAAFTAIHRLAEGRVLKSHGSDQQGNVVYALQHDGFGPALDTWGETARGQIGDVLASEVGSFGVFIGSQGQESLSCRQLKNLLWSGCRIESITFREVHFHDCIFSGSWFEKCEFDRCTFERCEFPAAVLNGCKVLGQTGVATFRQCQMNSMAVMGGEWGGDSVIAEGCEAKGLLVMANCKWRSRVLFKHADLSSSIIQDITLAGSVEFLDCELRYAQLWTLVGNDPRSMKIQRCRLHGALVVDYKRLSDTDIAGNKEVNIATIADPPSNYRPAG